MKTPEEIKKGLECRARAYCEKCMYECSSCDVYVEGRFSEIFKDALAYIQQLESRLAQAERERDAAVKDLSDRCMYCKHAINSMEEPPCKDCFQRSGNYPYSPMIRTNFEWRGPWPENTKEADSGGETTSASDA